MGKFLEARCEGFVAVPAAVQHILLENLGMFSVNVIRKESNVLTSGESAIGKRTKHVRRVEEAGEPSCRIRCASFGSDRRK
jgi:hypothetical protein